MRIQSSTLRSTYHTAAVTLCCQYVRRTPNSSSTSTYCCHAKTLKCKLDGCMLILSSAAADVASFAVGERNARRGRTSAVRVGSPCPLIHEREDSSLRGEHRYSLTTHAATTTTGRLVWLAKLLSIPNTAQNRSNPQQLVCTIHKHHTLKHGH